MSMYGSNSIAWFLVGGYSLLSAKLQGLTAKIEAIQARTDGLGDSAEEHTPVGLKRGMLTQEGAFFDDRLAGLHQAMKDAPGLTRVTCLSLAGNVVGQPFVGFEGAVHTGYEVLAKLGDLTKANVTYLVSGALEHGKVLQELATKTEDWNGTTLDNSASSSNGGSGYLQVVSSFGAFTGKIQHSSDGSTWVDLITFTTVTSSPTAQRSTVTGTVNRFLRFTGNVWGEASPSLSPSASTSLSPSVSASASTSPSRSPSSSVSPSISTSGSISPSASASASRSPSASVSPSVSASASASPSSEAGIYGTVTVMAGFYRA